MPFGRAGEENKYSYERKHQQVRENDVLPAT